MSEEFSKLQECIDEILSGKNKIRVLEAGCGSASRIHFSREVHLVGIDISEKQLQRNTMLREKVLGDVQYYDFPSSCFDVIICWDVLEHLPKPEFALRKFAKSVKEEGIVVLKLPNVFSLKGLLTKYLPYSFHVMIYRYFWNMTTTTDDIGPFKTYLRFSIAPNAINEFAINNGFQVVFFETYDVMTSNWLRQKKMIYATYRVIRALVKLLSMGKLGDSDYAIILKKQSS